MQTFALLLAGAVALVGCLSDSAEEAPLSSKSQGLLGDWRLALADVEPDEFAFSYSFARGGTFTNRIGGAFLKRIEELNEIEGIDIKTGRIDALDGGFLIFSGTWSEDGESLDLVFDTLEIEVFGTVPLIGRLALPIHSEPLAGDNQLRYGCRIAGGRLTLDGQSLTLGIGASEIAGLDPLAAAVLRMVGDFALSQLSASDADEYVMTRVD